MPSTHTPIQHLNLRPAISVFETELPINSSRGKIGNRKGRESVGEGHGASAFFFSSEHVVLSNGNELLQSAAP